MGLLDEQQMQFWPGYNRALELQKQMPSVTDQLQGDWTERLQAIRPAQTAGDDAMVISNTQMLGRLYPKKPITDQGNIPVNQQLKDMKMTRSIPTKDGPKVVETSTPDIKAANKLYNLFPTPTIHPRKQLNRFEEEI